MLKFVFADNRGLCGAGAALAVAVMPFAAFAQSAPTDQINAIEKQIQDLQGQLQSLKRELGGTKQKLRQSERAARRAQAQAQQATQAATQAQTQTPAIAPPRGPRSIDPGGRSPPAGGTGAACRADTDKPVRA